MGGHRQNGVHEAQVVKIGDGPQLHAGGTDFRR